MSVFFRKLTYLCLCVLCWTSAGYALPPLGFTQISPDSNLQPNLELIDGTAYLGVADGVWTVDSSGAQDFVSITHPELGSPISITRVVQANDGNLYAAGNFLVTTFFSRPALYNLDQPSSPLVIWDGGFARGVDSFLRTFDIDATILHLDGSSERLSYPGGGANVSSVTPSGYVLGDAHIPGTAGTEPAFWTPSGEFSFFGVCCISSTIRDREDGNGVNIGWDGAGIKYGSAGPIDILDENGSGLGGYRVDVSQTDFSIVQFVDAPDDLIKYAFYPGIVPGFNDRAAPLLDIFPELSSIDIDTVHDLASVDGYLYMTLSGADGTFLFGARDPSVAVPEPASAILFSIIALVMAQRVR